jgi:hypothetical protein
VRNNPLNLTDPTGLLWCTANYDSCVSGAGYTYLKQHSEIGPDLWMLSTHHIDDQFIKDLGMTPAQFANLAKKLAQHQATLNKLSMHSMRRWALESQTVVEVEIALAPWEWL